MFEWIRLWFTESWNFCKSNIAPLGGPLLLDRFGGPTIQSNCHLWSSHHKTNLIQLVIKAGWNINMTSQYTDLLTDLRFYVPLDKKCVVSETLYTANFCLLMRKTLPFTDRKSLHKLTIMCSWLCNPFLCWAPPAKPGQIGSVVAGRVSSIKWRRWGGLMPPGHWISKCVGT